MIKSLKNQKGAISLFAVLSIMFFIAFMIGAYRIVSANNGMQITSLTTIKERYMKTDEDVKKDYNKIVSSDKRIPISSYENFKQIGTKNSIIYNGKVYYCGDDKNYTYYLTNDIAFDLDREYDSNSGKLETAKGDFIPPSIKLQTHLEDSETTYKIEPGQFDIVYYKNNEKYKLLEYQHGDYTKIDKNSDVAGFKTVNTNKYYYYGVLKSYSDDIADPETDRYKTSDGKYNHLLIYNIPNTSALNSALSSVGMSGRIENGGFFTPGLYVKWEQTSSILSESATGVKINTEGNPNQAVNAEFVNINGIKLNPISISKVHFPQSIPIVNTFFRGLCYDSNLKSPYRSFLLNIDNYQLGMGLNTENIAVYAGYGSFSAMSATKAMLFVKIND